MIRWLSHILFKKQQKIAFTTYKALILSVETEIEKEKRYITKVFIISLIGILLSVILFIVSWLSDHHIDEKEMGAAIGGAAGSILSWVSGASDKLRDYQQLLAELNDRIGDKASVSDKEFQSLTIDILKNYKLP